RRRSRGRLQPERSRAGVPEPAGKRTRGDAARRADRDHRPLDRRRRRNLGRRHGVRNPRGRSVARARALLHDEGERKRPRPVDLPIGALGSRRHAHDTERARKRHRRPRRRSRGRVAAAGAVVLKPARILVVDDEPGMVRAVERVLGGEYQVAGTQRSREALAMAEDFRPDLAIVDIRMPDLDGFELMARLKARFPAVDVILMTGSVDDLDEKLVRAIRSPAFYFIQKPFDREVLKTLVERCVELRWRREDHRQNLKRLETEISEARVFQQSLLPEREARVNGVSICCRYTPCSALGGDLYDYADAGAGRTAVLIADVSGHGVSAAMLTGIVKSAFHLAHVDGFEPDAVVRRVSTGLAAFSPD